MRSYFAVGNAVRRDVRESDRLHVLIEFDAVADFGIEDRLGLNRLDELQDQGDAAGLAALSAELAAEREVLIAELGRLLDQGDYTGAGAQVREWMFLDRIAAQARAANPA